MHWPSKNIAFTVEMPKREIARAKRAGKFAFPLHLQGIRIKISAFYLAHEGTTVYWAPLTVEDSLLTQRHIECHNSKVKFSDKRIKELCD